MKLLSALAVGFLLAGPLSAQDFDKQVQDFQKGWSAYIDGDHHTAFQEFLLLAEQGYARANFMLGGMYKNGYGVPRDYIEAVKWYHIAVENGFAPAQSDLDEIAEKMTPADISEAQHRARVCMDSNYQDCDGLLLVGPVSAQNPFDKFDGITAYDAGDYSTAFDLLRPWAEDGEAFAQNYLGLMYDKGQGVIQDYAEAMKWYRLAAEQGVADAQRNVGFKHDKGQGIIQDYAEAMKWYRLAAEQGDAYAQFNLGVTYQYARGVLQSDVMAHMWYNIASANGANGAGKLRDKRAELMTPAEISEAQRRARVCMASNYQDCD